ncbi:hypothetical protein BJ944DRAFT_261790 [Cunninghamella echinulata]|nr:hypothetical protein BJ944DRAFT_261790 [Cunninghamella echinulata]
MSRYQQLSTVGDEDEISSNTQRQQSQSNHSPINISNNNNNVTAHDKQRTDLEDTFGENFDDDEDDEDDQQADTQRLLPSSSTTEPSTSRSIPFRQQPSSTHPAVLPVTNDGVFSNMSAKPESESTKVDETPPTYDVAIADATPPYWQTTVIAPLGMGDIILVEGLPVGSILGFAWNLLVSASFQFVGFMLTYLLHTSHASKNGSLAGLGVSLVQFGFYIRSRESLLDESEDGNDDNNNNNDEESLDADILSYILMIIGWFIIIRAIADYTRAKKMESIIGQEPTADNMV